MDLPAESVRREVRRVNPGSLTLAELLDEYCEEIYVSLLMTYRFDLAAWLRGDVQSAPGLVLAMIRHLPEGTPFTARMSAQAEIERKQREAEGIPDESEPLDELTELTREHVVWTQDRILMATLINRTSDGIKSHLEKKNQPEWPVVGPVRWWPEEQKTKMLPATPETDNDSLMAVLGRMGNMGG